jgi:hypothetical protein
MNTDYSLRDSYVNVHGGGISEKVDEIAKHWVRDHYQIAFAALIVLTFFMIWMVVKHMREEFNPTVNLRDQDSDQPAFSRREHLAPGRATSVFAQQTQGASGVLAGAPGSQPGSLSWQILHSADYNCDNRKAAGDDAWSWMNGVAHETMASGKPTTDNDFSKKLSGM